jgi:hypothetical protein
MTASIKAAAAPPAALAAHPVLTHHEIAQLQGHDATLVGIAEIVARLLYEKVALAGLAGGGGLVHGIPPVTQQELAAQRGRNGTLVGTMAIIARLINELAEHMLARQHKAAIWAQTVDAGLTANDTRSTEIATNLAVFSATTTTALHGHTTQLSDHSDKIGTLDTAAAAATTSLDQHTAELTANATQSKETASNLATFTAATTATLHNHNAQLAEDAKKIGVLDTAAAAAKTKLDQHTVALAEASAKIDKVATQARHTHDAAAAHTGLLAEFGAKLAEYSMAATAANREHAERLAEAAARIAALEPDIAAVKTAIGIHGATLQTHASDHAALTLKTQAVLDTVEQQQSEMRASLEQLMLAHEVRGEELDARLVEQRRLHDSLAAQTRTLHESVPRLEREREELTHRMTELEKIVAAQPRTEGGVTPHTPRPGRSR